MTRRPCPPRRHAGFSLIELMTSITIGALILVAISVVFQVSSNLQRQREDADELNLPLKQAVDLLRLNISQAGYVDLFDQANGRHLAASLIDPLHSVQANLFVRVPGSASAPVSAPLQQFFPGLTPVYGCDGAMLDEPKSIVDAGPPAALGCGDASPTRHTLQLAYQAVPVTPGAAGRSLPVADMARGDGMDCAQQEVKTPTGIVINRFYVGVGNSVATLYCKGPANTQTQPVTRGVEEFVLRYQVSQPGAPGAAAGGAKSRYLSASQVSADSVGWAGVTAIEVCMVAATPKTRGAAATGTAQLQPTRPTCTRDSDGAFNANVPRAASDTRLWQRVVRVFSVRNAVFATPATGL